MTMTRTPRAFAMLAAACALTLGACSKQADTSPQTGSSGADAPVGTTGSTTAGANPQPLPGQGLNGGLDAEKKANAGSATMGAGGSTALDGSTNTTPGNAVGQR